MLPFLGKHPLLCSEFVKKFPITYLTSYRCSLKVSGQPALRLPAYVFILRFLLQHLDGFSKDQFPVHALGRLEAYLTGNGKEFI